HILWTVMVEIWHHREVASCRELVHVMGGARIHPTAVEHQQHARMRAPTMRDSYMHVHRPPFGLQVNGFFKGFDFFHRSSPALIKCLCLRDDRWRVSERVLSDDLMLATE